MGSNPQRLAWITLLGGLLIFIVLCISSVVFTRWVLFESPTQLNTTLYVGRGTVGLAAPDASDEKAVRTNAQLGRHNRLSTDNVSEGYIAFSDPYSGQIIATVMLRSASVISVANSSRPRFNLSDNPYSIRLSGANGNFEVWVAPDLDREIRMDIEGLLGTTRIGQSGTFLIDSNPAYLSLTVRDGFATLLTADRHTQHLGTSAKGTITPGAPEISVSDGPIDLLPNSNFGLSNDWPVNWTCYSEPDNPTTPRGDFERVTVDGRAAIQLVRLGGQDPVGHGETGCVQFLADRETGLDVHQYESLRLRVTMLVRYQSLSACGERGSECPVMLFIQYRDLYGNLREWRHGFYADYTPNVGLTTCDTCLEEHEQINKEAWYTYESGNLVDLPKDLRPGSIIQVKFYASGHRYDVMLSEVSLVATRRADLAAAPDS